MFQLLLFIAAAYFVNAQIMYGGKPTERSLLKSEIQTFNMPSFDVQAFLEQKFSEPKHQFGGNLFAQQFNVAISPLNSGTWETLSDGTQVWRVEITSPGALTINLWLSSYTFYPGNELYVYSADMKYVRGQFNEKNNKPNGRMAIAPISGDDIIVEIRVAPNAEMPLFEIGKVNHEVGTASYGSSGACNINTICPYTDNTNGFNYRDEVDSVAMILSNTGSRRCTGAMINNYGNSTNLFLTANHCDATTSDDWILMFRYESPECNLNQQSDGPTRFTLQGMRTIDQSATSDVLLMQALEYPPADYNVFYAGYNANDVAHLPFAIHHPSGDIKKIAWSEQNTVSDEWSAGNRDTHWQVVQWHGPGTGAGNQGDRTTTEPGSSGSPLFDNQGRITGQLHGGAATCTYPYDDLYGKLARSWDDRAAIRAALDPEQGSRRTLDGRRA
eukprot:c55002_g1_i1.p1 GENE.c55002_g1_i1~~c55002_g1_i1.p1  ORF type:complete len:443 (-),score=40.60 c55002_g1_i1:28-1356(-)